MRALPIAAFVLDGIAAVSFAAVLALGEGRPTAFNALVLVALLVGFFSALAVLVQPDEGAAKDEETATLLIAGAAMFDDLTDDAKDDVRQHFPHPERRERDRRAPSTEQRDEERRTGQDRRGSPIVGGPVSMASAIDRELAHVP